MRRFYHIIGHTDKNGDTIYKFGYRFERAWYHFRQLIAFIICPELRATIEREKFNLDYVIANAKHHVADVRARDKAIARLQKERKQLRNTIRELREKTNAS